MTPKELASVAEAVLLNPSAAALRSRFPKLAFSECSEDDIPPRYTPAMEVDGHSLYLFTGASGHCLELTGDLAAACGVVVAAKADED